MQLPSILPPPILKHSLSLLHHILGSTRASFCDPHRCFLFFHFWGCLFAGSVFFFFCGFTLQNRSFTKNLSDELLGSGSCWHLRVGYDNLRNVHCIKSQKPLILRKAKKVCTHSHTNSFLFCFFFWAIQKWSIFPCVFSLIQRNS